MDGTPEYSVPNLEALAVAVKKRIISTTTKNAYSLMNLDLILDAFSRRTRSYFLYFNHWPIEPAIAIFLQDNRFGKMFPH